MNLSGFCRTARFASFAVLLLAAGRVVLGQTSTQSGGRPSITGIAFMRVFTTDPAAADKFYGPIMGFPHLSVGEESLFPINQSQWIEVSHTGAPPTPNGRLLAIGFTTTDLEALRRFLVQHGIQPEDRSGAGSFSVRDPEGNVVTFVQAGNANRALERVAASQSLPSATSDRIIHVGFMVRDRAKEDTFWQGILGFRPYWYGTAHPGRTDWVSLQVPDGTDWLEYMLNPPENPDLHTAGVMNHFSLGVDRMQTVLAGLQRNGCEGKMCTAIQAGMDGKIQLNLFDPDQTRVEYMEFQPVMKPCCSEFTAKNPSESDPVK